MYLYLTLLPEYAHDSNSSRPALLYYKIAENNVDNLLEDETRKSKNSFIYLTFVDFPN